MTGRATLLFLSIFLSSLVFSESQEPDCPEFRVRNGKVVKVSAAARQITCNDYFIAKGNIAPVCVKYPDRYKWTTYPAKCVQNFCAHDERFIKGKRGVTVPGLLSRKYPHVLRGGQSISFKCAPGYRLDTPVTSVGCVIDLDAETSRFTGPIPECVSLCETIERKNGLVTVSPSGTTGTLTCGSYYAIKGRSVVTCVLRDGQYIWDDRIGECVINYCKNNERLNKGNRIVNTPSSWNPKYPNLLRGGETVSFSCKPGFKLDDPVDSVRCVTDPNRGLAKFDKKLPECVTLCGTPKAQDGVPVVSSDGLTASISCNGDRQVTGPASIRCILVNGKYRWERQLGRCDINYCSGAKAMYSERRRIISGFDPDNFDIVRAGGTIGFTCQAGFKMKGPQSITCVHSKIDGSNRWSADPPQCIGCPKGLLGRPTHGWVTFSLDGSVATFTCDPGYIIYGPASIDCQDDGRWSDRPPICESV